MVIEILMPSVGAGSSHGKILNWCKKVGDKILVGDVLAEIETDKAVIEVEAFDEGVLHEVLVHAGDEEVLVGQRIALLMSTEERNETTSYEQVPIDRGETDAVLLPDLNEQEVDISISKSSRSFASPSARRIARELEVDLNNIVGTGPKGRIVRVDIEREAERLQLSKGGKSNIQKFKEKNDFSDNDKVIHHTNMRKTIARRLLESKQSIPHFYLSISCQMDKIVEIREQLNESIAIGQKLSINDILVFAIAKAVLKVPEVNRRWTEESAIENSSVDVSVAVSTDAGLLTPIVRNVETKTLFEVASDISKLIDKARSGKLLPEEYDGGSLTISNLGMYGVESFSAIINPPQSVILAVGAITPQAIVKNGELAIGEVMSITLSADHRIIDGVIGARFLQALKQLLESPYLLLA